MAPHFGAPIPSTNTFFLLTPAPAMATISDDEPLESNEGRTPQMLRSVSCPIPRRPTARNKGFVRPNCSTTFWLQCPVCCKRYFKYDAHFECFTRWCEICQDALPSAIALRQHAQRYHRKKFCVECNNVYENIRGHKTNEHPDSGNKKRKKTPIQKMERAQTSFP